MWQNWVSAVLGLWFIVSPWVFGFSDMKGAIANNIITGALVAILSYLATTQGKQKSASHNM